MTRARDIANLDGLLTTTGDTYYASAAATPARLGIGTTGQLLTVAGGVPTWAAPSTTKSYSLLSTTSTTTGTSYTVSSLSGYDNLLVMFKNVTTSDTGNNQLYLRPNNF